MTANPMFFDAKCVDLAQRIRGEGVGLSDLDSSGGKGASVVLEGILRDEVAARALLGMPPNWVDIVNLGYAVMYNCGYERSERGAYLPPRASSPSSSGNIVEK